MRIAVALTGLVLLTLRPPGVGRAQVVAATCDQTCWREAMAAYAANPNRERGRLLTLERLGTQALPPEILLLLADAHLRSGHDRAAEELFGRVSGLTAPEVFRSWALLGGAWMAAGSGDVDRAVALLGEANAGEFFEPAAVLLVGYLEASRGTASGVERLQDLLADARATPEIRSAAHMMLGLTHHWSGAPDLARREFQSVADDEGSALEDEATYAVARMMLAEGRVAEAKARLERLAANQADLPDDKLPPGLIDLQRRALVRAGFKGYRRGALGPPAAQVVRLLDWNGAALARALLARLAREDRVDPEIQPATLALPDREGDLGAVASGAWHGADPLPRAAPGEAAQRRSSTRTGGDAGGSQQFALALLGLAALVILASALLFSGRAGVRPPSKQFRKR